MPTVLQDVKEVLEYPHVEELSYEQSAGELTWTMVAYRVMPTDAKGGVIDIVFDEEREHVQCVGWESWHGHFDGNSDERVNTRNALRFARNIIRGRYVLVEFADYKGVYKGSSVERCYDFKQFIKENEEIYRECSQCEMIDHYRISQFGVGSALVPPKVEQETGCDSGKPEHIS